MHWTVEWLLDRAEDPPSIPGYSFLKALPINVRVQLLAILDAVRTTGPDRWADRHTTVRKEPPPFASADDFIRADLSEDS